MRGGAEVTSRRTIRMLLAFCILLAALVAILVAWVVVDRARREAPGPSATVKI